MSTRRKLLACGMTVTALGWLGGCDQAPLTVNETPETAPETSALSASAPVLAILTTNAIKAGSSDMIGAYATFKRLTQPTIIVTETKTYLSNGTTQNTGWAAGATLPQPTDRVAVNVRAEAIRAWLKANRSSLGIKDLLLIGNPCPLMGDLPMKAFFPLKNAEWDRPDNGGYISDYCLAPRNPLPTTNAGCTLWKDKHDISRALPTDYYYSNLTYEWLTDSDNDIVQIDLTDFTHQDINVGRIPVTGNNFAALDKILAKSISYTASTDTAWRKNALLSMDTHGGVNGTWVPYGETLRNQVLLPAGFSTYRIYWTWTTNDCNSASDQQACLSYVNVLGDVHPTSITAMGSVWAGSAWPGCSGAICSQPKRNFGLVHWTGHGSPTWGGNAIDVSTPGNYTESLDDTHPAFAISQTCSNLDPTFADNIGAVLLRKGAIGVLGATRISWPDENNWHPTPYSTHSGNSDVTYGFIDELVASGLAAGAALSQVRTHLAGVISGCTDHDSRFDQAGQLLLFSFYGDPTIGLANQTNPSVVTLPSDTPTNVALTAGQTKTFFADNWPGKGNPYWTANVVLSISSLTGQPIPSGTARVNGVAYPFGGGLKYYQVLDVPDKGPYTIEISATAATTIQIDLGNR